MGTSQKIPDQYALNIFALARWHKTIRPGMEQRFPYRKDIHKRCLQQRYAGSRSRNLCWVYRILRVPTWSDLHNKPSRPSVQIQSFFFRFCEGNKCKGRMIDSKRIHFSMIYDAICIRAKGSFIYLWLCTWTI